LPIRFSFLMIRSAHWTAAATSDSVLGLERLSNRSSVVFKCRATRIPATISSTRLRPSSITTHGSRVAFYSLKRIRVDHTVSAANFRLFVVLFRTKIVGEPGSDWPKRTSCQNS
jgi:hypothetical protein